MDVTVRLWTTDELQKAKTGEDLWLSTLLLNRHTFSADEMAAYPHDLRQTYIANLNDGDSVTIYAPNEFHAQKFLAAQYIPGAVESLYRVETQFVRIRLD